MIYLVGILFLFWVVRIGFVIIYGKKEHSKNSNGIVSNQLPFVSVIIPARNEEKNISKCLEAIIKSDYPEDKLEVLCIDDNSKDLTAELISEYANKISFIRHISTAEYPKDSTLFGKTGALQVGFDLAKGDLLLMTDADCRVQQNWISQYANTYLLGYDFIAGITYMKPTGFFTILQSLEWIYLASMGASGVGFDMPMGCYGNNIGISTKLKDEIGAYKNLPFSIVEDQQLMLEAKKANAKQRYIINSEIAVFTQSEETLKAYLNQHARWVQGGRQLGGISVFFVVTSLSLWIIITLGIVSNTPILILLALLSRILGDLIVIVPNLLKLNERKMIKWLPIASIFFMLVELIAPFLLLKTNHTWKNRKIKV